MRRAFRLLFTRSTSRRTTEAGNGSSARSGRLVLAPKDSFGAGGHRRPRAVGVGVVIAASTADASRIEPTGGVEQPVELPVGAVLRRDEADRGSERCAISRELRHGLGGVT